MMTKLINKSGGEVIFMIFQAIGAYFFLLEGDIGRRGGGEEGSRRGATVFRRQVDLNTSRFPFFVCVALRAAFCW